MDELITQLGTSSGPCERVVQEHFGSIVHPDPDGGIHDRADAAVQELRKTWGPTASPHWVDGILPGRGEEPNELESDGYFALFHRPGIWGYVCVRVPETDTPENAYMRLVFGVIRDTNENLA